MINLLALALLTASLAAGGLFSPPPSPPKPHDPIVREGHRVVIVEYERQLPADQHASPDVGLHKLTDKFQEAASALPNLGQGVSTPLASHAEPQREDGVKERICDAYGNCKDRVSSMFKKGKEKASDAKDEISQKAGDVSDKILEKTKSAKDAVKENLSDKASDVADRVKRVNEKISDKASHAKDTVKDEARDAVNTVSEKARDAKDVVKDKLSESAAQVEKGAQDVSGNISAAAGKAVATAEKAAANLTDIIKRAKGVAYDAASLVNLRDTARALAAAVHLLAVSATYGASIWVTFVSSHLLARTLPRQQFGVVQSRLYPVYFRTLAYGAGVSLVAHWLRRGGNLQGYNLAGVLAAMLLNLMYFEPKATKVMFEMMKVEKEEGRGQDVADMADTVVETSVAAAINEDGTQTAAFVSGSAPTLVIDREAVRSRIAKLSRRLGKLNRYSSMLNIVALMGLTWHIVDLARCMQVRC